MTGPKENIEEIATTPALRAECEASLRQLDILIEAAGDKMVINALAPLVLVFGKSVEAESPLFWRVYTEALSDLPRMALDRAVGEWQRVGKFFPKPAELRELAERHAQPLRQARFRVKSAIEFREPVKPKAAPLDQESYARMMEDFNARMKAMQPPPPKVQRPAPPCGVLVPGTHMTAEMAELLQGMAE